MDYSKGFKFCHFFLLFLVDRCLIKFQKKFLIFFGLRSNLNLVVRWKNKAQSKRMFKKTCFLEGNNALFFKKFIYDNRHLTSHTKSFFSLKKNLPKILIKQRKLLTLAKLKFSKKEKSLISTIKKVTENFFFI